jgi:murein DD-endopeptidase MepM/ murein hydrolase activator NlpD
MLLHPLKNTGVPISSPFGNRVHPVTKEWKFHNGIDMAVPNNTPVYAPEDGFVSGVLTNEAGGLQLLINHPSVNLRSGYAHLNKRFVKDDQKVNKGQLIALTGNTGRSTGPHLHFSLKTIDSKEYVDPDKLNYMSSFNYMDWKKWLLIAGAVGGGYLLYRRYGK